MSEPLIEIQNLSKMYRLFRHPRYRILNLLGFPIPKTTYNEFWALRDINLMVKSGQRLGIIGRNGAGKSTLLKIIAGLLQPTSGVVKVRGKVQALMELGTGFHHEFTGRENVFAALSYQGITGREAQRRFEEIVEFSELEEFIDNPFKTYSAGMQARLAFSVSTAIEPEILIVDEVLGAGDAYFLSKSSERVAQIVQSGASVLLVSHALDQITRFCDKAIWIDRGKIIDQGTSLEVVKAYSQYVRVLENRRLKAKNRKRNDPGYKPSQYDIYSENLTVRFTVKGEANAACDIAEIRLLENGQVLDQLLVGDAQDSDPHQSAFVGINDSDWSEPRQADDRFFRSLRISENGASLAVGSAIFYQYSFFDNSDYAIELTYRCQNGVSLFCEVGKNGRSHTRFELSTLRSGWITKHITLNCFGSENSLDNKHKPDDLQVEKNPIRTIRRWPGEGTFTVEHVILKDSDGNGTTVIKVGTPITLNLLFKCHKSGIFDIIPVAVLFRVDGILISRYIGEKMIFELNVKEKREIQLDFGPINLGNGHYVFSVALYRKLDIHNLEEPEIYDLIDRSYEFEVFGTPPLKDGIFQHPGEWKLV